MRRADRVGAPKRKKSHTVIGALAEVTASVVAYHEGKAARAALRRVRGELARLLGEVDKVLAEQGEP